MGDSNPDPDGHQQPHQQAVTPSSSPPAETVSPSMTVHPVNNSAGAVTTTFSGMPMHMYPFPPGMVNHNTPRTKRRQVKNACTNCQKACKKCDDARPCLRCVKYGIAEECVDSQRKERQKGIKRGPYKKRDGKANSVEHQLDVSVSSPSAHGTAGTTAMAAGMPQVYPYAMPFPGFMQYPANMLPANMKPGEMPFVMPPIVLAPLPAHMHDGEAPSYPPAGLYPIALAGYPHYPHPVMLPHAHARPDQQMLVMPPYYQPTYLKSPRDMPNGEVSSQGAEASTSRRDARVDHGRMAEAVAGTHIAQASGNRD